MKIQTYGSIIVFIAMMILIALVVIIMANSMKDDILFECYKAKRGNLTLHGDFSGELDCNKFYQDFYADGKWANQCSTWIFSDRMSCHDLCNIDCDYNAKHGGIACVC